MNYHEIIDLFFEWGHLRRIKHEGWRLVGVAAPESVADHSLRAAQIGFVLAHMEDYSNPYEVCAMLVFHDIAETRIGDIHKVANRYVDVNEEKSVQDQVSAIGKMGEVILDLWRQAELKSTTAGVIAKDADVLEQAFTAKEYIELGYERAHDWLEKINNLLRTKSAKKLMDKLHTSSSTAWWDGLKKIDK